MNLPRQTATTAVTFILLVLAVRSHTAGPGDRSLSRFTIAGIKGWTPAEDEYKEFGPDDLYDLINGGADIYIDKGLQKGSYQKLLQDDSYQCEILVEDFGSSENARNIFAATTETAVSSLKFGPGSNEHLRIKEFIGGLLVYMYHDNYYFEISASGFDTVEEAGTAVKPFINFFNGILVKDLRR